MSATGRLTSRRVWTSGASAKILGRMKTILVSVMGFGLSVILMTACGDSTPGFGGGGTICASDDPDVGNTLDCPSGEKTIDFCVNTRNGSCYYVIDGDQIDCGNCAQGGNISTCAQEAVARCD